MDTLSPFGTMLQRMNAVPWDDVKLVIDYIYMGNATPANIAKVRKEIALEMVKAAKDGIK